MAELQPREEVYMALRSTKALRREFRFEAVLPASPEQAFPLLCPIREHEWIEGWRASAVYAPSGVAEEGALFRTRLARGELWVTTHHEPPSRVSFTICAGRHVVVVLDSRLAPLGVGRARWQITRTYTGIDWMGRRQVRALTEKGVRAEHELLARRLDHFLTSGQMLRVHRGGA